MKPTKSIYILLSLFLISNCGDKVREEITERYDDEQKKVLVGYKGKGSDEEIVKRIEYYKNGEISLEGNYKDGKEDGKWTFYDKDGSLIGEGIYQYGLQWSGFFIDYYKNGQKWVEVNTKEGKLDGKWTTYRENGQINLVGNLKDGKQIGKWTDYKEDGSISKVEEYKDGRLVK